MKHLFTNYGDEETPLYYAAEVAKKLNIPRNSINRYCNRLNSSDVIKNKILPIKKTHNGDEFIANMECNLITINGLKTILTQTRRPIPKEILDHYNITEFNRFQCEEAKFLRQIVKVFEVEEIILQHCVAGYKIDAYFPKHNLIIEIDEDDHQYYSTKGKLERCVALNYHLHNPKVIRCNPFNADIFDVLARIYKILC